MNSYADRVVLHTLDKALVDKIVIEATELALTDEAFAKSRYDGSPLYNPKLRFDDQKLGKWTHRTWLWYEFFICERTTSLWHMEDCLEQAAQVNGIKVEFIDVSEEQEEEQYEAD